MFTKYKKNKKTKKLLLDPLAVTNDYSQQEKIDLILAPSLYWVKKLSLPVKTTREAIKLLPSIFEEYLPKGTYTYTAYKENDLFFAFAYEEKKIIQTIHQQGINPANVVNVYFAQSIFPFSEQAIKINQTQVMLTNEQIFVLAPLEWSDHYEALSLENLSIPKHKLNIQLFVSIVNNSSLYKIASLLVALIVIFMIELLITNAKINTLAQSKSELFSKYKLQATMLQNRSTLKKYKKIDKIQKKLRTELSKILVKKLPASQSINKIYYKDSLLKVFITDKKGKTTVVESAL